MNLLKNSLIAPSLALLLASSLYANDRYSVDTSSLGDAIKLISQKADMPYVVDMNILKGKSANEVKDATSLESALEKLLEGTGLEAIIKNNTIVIREKKLSGSKTTLGDVDVIANSDEGTANAGYLVKNTSDIGIWRGKSLQDTPYALNVMSEDLMENLQATSTDQLYNINPVMQVNANQSQYNNGYVMLRGFQATTSAFDGMRRERGQYTHNTNVEEYERLETITGLSGFLYGASPIGGIRNFIAKRPNSEAQHSITLGNAGGKSGYYAHADLSGPLTADRKLGYRLNVMNQDSDTHVTNQHIKKQILNLALDYKITDNILIQGTVSDSKYRQDGRQPYWNFDTGVTRLSASEIDSNKLWAQKWTYQDTKAKRYSTNFLWNITDNVNFRAAYMKEKITRGGGGGVTSLNTIQADGTYTQKTNNNTGAKQVISAQGFNAFLDFDFNTKTINHQLTVGLQKSDTSRDSDNVDYTNSTVTLTGLTFDSPSYVDAPMNAPIVSITNNSHHRISTNYTIGDSISLTPKWDLLVGASYAELEYKVDNYKESTVTPSISVVYKPIENLSIYSSYMEGLELGGIAGETHGGYDVINANESMDPLMSDQIELGAKLTVKDMLLTAAVFNIDKGLEYYDTTDITKPKYVQDGRQVHKGFEFTAIGKIRDDLTTIGGFTLLDAKVKENKANPELEGKNPKNVASEFAKLYLEYTPFSDMQLALNAGVNYTGSFYGDNINTDKIPSYTLTNIGIRYTTQTTTNPLTFRVNVNNAFDKQYWVNNNYLGDRRTLHASVSMKF